LRTWATSPSTFDTPPPISLPSSPIGEPNGTLETILQPHNDHNKGLAKA
jgi:hypothetical protein